MTLEQIKNRQEYINGLLYTLLNDTTIVVEKIVGKQNNEEMKSAILLETSGLLEEITASQNTTESYIYKIANYNNILSNNTFSPSKSEVACTGN
jgi:hypothetical protein